MDSQPPILLLLSIDYDVYVRTSTNSIIVKVLSSFLCFLRQNWGKLILFCCCSDTEHHLNYIYTPIDSLWILLGLLPNGSPAKLAFDHSFCINLQCCQSLLQWRVQGLCVLWIFRLLYIIGYKKIMVLAFRCMFLNYSFPCVATWLMLIQWRLPSWTLLFFLPSRIFRL